MLGDPVVQEGVLPMAGGQFVRPQRMIPHRGPSLFSEEVWRGITRSLGLSQREAQVVQGIFENLTDGAIARELGISSHTVHTHIQRVYHKLAVGGRVQLVVHVFARYLQLVSGTDPRGTAWPAQSHDPPVLRISPV